MLAVGVVAGLSTLLVAAIALAAVLVAGQTARKAADLAALAAAGRVVQGGGEAAACAAAARVVVDNGGQLQSCRTTLVGTDPWPQVRVSVSSRAAATAWTATAHAVAGGVARPGG